MEIISVQKNWQIIELLPDLRYYMLRLMQDLKFHQVYGYTCRE